MMQEEVEPADPPPPQQQQQQQQQESSHHRHTPTTGSRQRTGGRAREEASGAGGGDASNDASSAGAAPTRRPPPTSTTSLPGTVVVKTFSIVAILLRFILWPIRRLSHILFPLGEFDDSRSSNVADRAARAFVKTFERRYLTPLTGGVAPFRPGVGSGASAADGAGNGSGAQTTNGSGVGGGGGGGAAGGEQLLSCPFVPSGYTATLQNLRSPDVPSTERPLLLVYLHSPLHRDADSFATKTLCDDRVLTYLNGENGRFVTCFGASIHTADGARAAETLGATGYPFVAMLSCKDGSGSSGSGGGGGGGGANGNGGGAGGGGATNATYTMEVLLKMESTSLLTITPDRFLSYIAASVRRHRDVLAEAEARRLRREEEARLRREQDREFQEALLADRQREAARREEEERARREAAEAEEAAQREAEEAANRITDARAKVSEEPPSGTVGCARIRLTLPNGRRIDRRFWGSDTIDAVRAFLIVHFDDNGMDITNFSLSTNYPKRTFDDGGVTLEEAGLVPQAVMMIQDLDA